MIIWVLGMIIGIILGVGLNQIVWKTNCRVTKECDEISQKLKYIEEFLKLKGINSQDIQEYIDSRQVADKLAEEE